MNEKDAREFVSDTFQSRYDDTKFQKFISELLNGGALKYGSLQPSAVKSPYKDFIHNYRLFGVFTDSDGKRILFLSVYLRRNTARDRARVMQRNFAADVLRGKISTVNGGDAAFIAFYDDSKEDWRLSFVTLDTELAMGEKGVEIEERVSPAKRYSYLVGVHEPCHTCMARFSPLIEDDSQPPTLKDIEDVFHVEAVTKEFFEEYKVRYGELKDSLQVIVDKDEVVRAEFERHNLKVADFSKKLMGQIVFLYFLQKKGWLGVAKDGEWGSGYKDFMRRLFDKKIIDYDNFFNDVLEPLFYEALNKRNDSDYYSRFNVRIPFLNGGLFEADYDWVKTNITIKNEVFEGIFETFDRYNFTIKEDEPLEREVAVDPEMLGKVFESLLDVDSRKEKGAFYTPRYIVHYICQESLIEYLCKHVEAPRSDIESFVRTGDEMYAEMVKKMLDSTYNKGVDSSVGGLPESISSQAEIIDSLLKEIKIADPAVGSGAFPVGMMNEIVKARNALTFCFDEGKNERTSYNLKRETIEHCIYGVDLDPSAVDIAKLRFWLSLIVDEENPKTIQPLPNLDHKIMAGNSLLENFRGIQLFDREILQNTDDVAEQVQEIDLKIAELTEELESIPWGQDQARYKRINTEIERLEIRREKLLSDEPQKEIIQSLSPTKRASFKRAQKGLKKYRVLQSQYFNEQDRYKKKDIREEMERLEWELIERKAEETNDSKLLAELQSLKGKRSKPFFLWELYFSEVFTRENPGFDCVIGNPPYVQLQVMDDDIKKEYESGGFETFIKTGDIYCLFYEKGYKLLRDGGSLGYITSNKWMRAGYGSKTRKFFAEKTNPVKLIDFSGTKIFDEATVDVNIMLFLKEENQGETCCCLAKKECLEKLSDFVQQGTQCCFDNDDSWVILSPIEQKIKKKIEAVGTPLKEWDIQINYGIKTGYNDAFIIDGKKRDELISEDPKSAEIIRPILRGKDIKRYDYVNADKWVIIIPSGYTNKHKNGLDAEDFIKNKYPAVYNHFIHVQDEYLRKKAEKPIKSKGLLLRDDMGDYWWELRSCAYMEEFSKQKIIYPNMTKYLPFIYDDTGYMTNQKCFIITGENISYLTAFFNSSLFKYCFRNNFPELQGGTRELSKIFFEKIPVKIVDRNTNEIFKQLVNEIQEKNKDGIDTHNLQIEIDNLLFGIYNLDDKEREEIGFIEIQ